MRAKHHTENNQLRKAWLRIRQAIACAQVTGASSIQQPEATLSEDQAERQRFVASIFELDHLISMVLGLPYAKDTAFTDARAFMVLLNPSINDENLKMRALRRIVAVTAAHINDRNVSGTLLDEFADSTQATLDMAAGAMSPAWWNCQSQPLIGPAVQRYEALMVQLWFWTVQTYLHLPYLIQNVDSGPAGRYRSLAMEGARNLIRAFLYLRTEPSMTVYMCNCDDFQALLASCILIVGVLQNASQLSSTPPVSPSMSVLSFMSESVDADLALIEDVKDVFRYRMTEQGGSISKQGLAVLDELTRFIYDDEDLQLNTPDFGLSQNPHERTIMLPYFGTIRVELARKVPKRRNASSASLPLPTPPVSTDDNFTDFSPFTTISQQNIIDGSCDLNTQTMYTNMNAFPNIDSTSNYAFNPSEGTFCAGSLPTPEQGTCDNTYIAPIAWDHWEPYMFDQELNKEWNPGLQDISQGWTTGFQWDRSKFLAGVFQ